MPKREADGNTSAERNACGWKRSPALSIPKGADISAFTRKQIQRIEDWINALPRKTLDGLSAEEKVKRHFEDIAA